MSGEGPSTQQDRMVYAAREGFLFLAKLAGASYRFEQMYRYAKKLVESVAPFMALTDHERRCFYSACAFLVLAKLNAYRGVVRAIREIASVDQWRSDFAKNYLQSIASDICKTCSDVVGIIDFYLLPAGGLLTVAATAESRVFYNKMKGDMLKYTTEVTTGVDRDVAVMDAFSAYKAATDFEAVLPATHPTRLELKLSLAIFYVEAYDMPSVAHRIASEAVDMATREMEATGKIATRETALLLGSLRSGMELWKNKNQVAEI